MLLAIVPAPPPTRKNQRTTSCPAPISANVPYQRGSRLIFNAFECVSIVSSFTLKRGSPSSHETRDFPIRETGRLGLTLRRGTDNNLAHVDIGRLLDREHHGSSDRVGRDP